MWRVILKEIHQQQQQWTLWIALKKIARYQASSSFRKISLLKKVLYIFELKISIFIHPVHDTCLSYSYSKVYSPWQARKQFIYPLFRKIVFKSLVINYSYKYVTKLLNFGTNFRANSRSCAKFLRMRYRDALIHVRHSFSYPPSFLFHFLETRGKSLLRNLW